MATNKKKKKKKRKKRRKKKKEEEAKTVRHQRPTGWKTVISNALSLSNPCFTTCK